MQKLRKIIPFLLAITMLSACNSALQSFKKGQKKFDNGEYELAIKELQKASTAGYELSKTNYLIAESYRLSNRPVLSADYYEKALTAGSKENDLRYHLATAQKIQGKYKEASANLEKYLSGIPSKEFKNKAQTEIDLLPEVEALANKKTYIELKPMNLNSTGTEFAPIPQGNELIFTASRKDVIYKNNGLPYLGLYRVALNTPTEAGTPTLFSPTIFKDNANEGTPTFSKDGKMMVFARGNSGKRKDLTPDVDLYLSKFDGTNWSLPEMLAISDSAAWDGTPAFSTDGKMLYFSSNRFGGQGGIDLWSAKFEPATFKFSKVTNLGKAYNTNGDDMFPYMDTDGKFYFASDGHPGLGRLDIFQANRQSGGRITIENMGQPFNSPADDFGLTIDKNGNMLFGSDRTGGQGNDDIYQCSKLELETFVTKKKEDERLKAEALKIKQAELANQKQIDLTPKAVNYFLAGTVRANNVAKSALPNTRVKVLDDATGNIVKEYLTGKEGHYGPLKVDPSRDYTILIEQENYLTKREPFTMEGKEIAEEKLFKPITDTTFFANVGLDKIVLNKSIKVENIYYDLNKYEIRSDAAITFGFEAVTLDTPRNNIIDGRLSTLL